MLSYSFLWAASGEKALCAEGLGRASPSGQLGPEELAIVVNDRDPPLSRKIADDYKKQRHIPEMNMLHIRIEPGKSNLSRRRFVHLMQEISRKTPIQVQAYVLTWAAPYRVDCMSITAAFTFGFDEAFCTQTCSGTKYNPYFNSASHTPYSDYKIRPAMALAAVNFSEAKKLIRRGIASDSTFLRSTGYLVSTNDKARNVRSEIYPTSIEYLGSKLRLERVDADYIKSKNDVLFYFTGVVTVPELQTNRFLPGAIADHLTSTGGQLTDSTQMSSLRWLEAGATGSYGTVVEPCNLADKFPSPGILITHYLAGDTLIEAYWKSVSMPGQGIFIGEPLARPYAAMPQNANLDAPSSKHQCDTC